MAGINPNLGNNLKLQNLQLSKTVNVGTPKDENTEIEDSRKVAVWVSCNGNWNNDFFNKVKLGDVNIAIDGNGVKYYRLVVINEQGDEDWVEIQADQVKPSDYEKDCGDLRW